MLFDVLREKGPNPNLLMPRSLISIIVLCLALQSFAGEEDRSAAKDFESLTLTRAWELGMWRVNNCKKHDEYSKNFKLSMTAQAFRYWLLAHKKMIQFNPLHDSQIRKAFASGELPIETLKNPLHKDAEQEGGFGVGIHLSVEEYANLAQEFERFVISKDEATKKDGEQDGTGQPATRPESKPKGSDNP